MKYANASIIMITFFIFFFNIIYVRVEVIKKKKKKNSLSDKYRHTYISSILLLLTIVCLLSAKGTSSQLSQCLCGSVRAILFESSKTFSVKKYSDSHPRQNQIDTRETLNRN